MSFFLQSHFLLLTKNLRVPRRNSCSYKKGSLGKDMPSIGTLVGLLLASTWQAASALLGLASLPSTIWFGLCQQPDWSPYRLDVHACIPGDCSWSLQGRVPNSATSSTLGSLKWIFHCQWSMCSNRLACLEYPTCPRQALWRCCMPQRVGEGSDARLKPKSTT